MPGVAPAVMGATKARASLSASMICTPAPFPALTSWDTNARAVILGGLFLDELPQLRNSKLADRKKNSRIRVLLKPGTPRACRIIT
jgi:hypothetical protein